MTFIILMEAIIVGTCIILSTHNDKDIGTQRCVYACVYIIEYNKYNII